MRKTIGLATFVLMLTAIGNSDAADFPKGTFSLKGPDGATWSIDFDGKETVKVSRDDKEAVIASYQVTKDEVVFTDQSGEFADPQKRPGTYKWKLDGKKLSFTKVKDESEGRAGVLTSGPWEMK